MRIASCGLEVFINLQKDSEDLGWLWMLRLYARGAALVNTDIDASIPYHLLPLLKKYASSDDEQISTADFQRLIETERDYFEKMKPRINGVLAKNISMLSRRFQLNRVEQSILTFVIVCRTHEGLGFGLDAGNSRKWLEQTVVSVLSVALSYVETEIELALERNGRLISSGLLQIEPNLVTEFNQKLLMSPKLIDAVYKKAKNVDELLSYAFKKMPTSKLSSREHFSHQLVEVRMLSKLLLATKRTNMPGVNILVHGLPGVGKTALVSALARELKLNAYSVSNDDVFDDEDISLELRFKNYRMLQKLLSNTKNGLVVFDEIEDVLPKPNSSRHGFFDKKGWVNELLETNPVPAVWIANHVWQIDPAFMRRFDLVLEVRMPPRSFRKQMLKKLLPTADDGWINSKSSELDLTPALIEKTASMLQRIGVETLSETQQLFDQQITARRNALGITTTKQRVSDPQCYKLDLLNTTASISSIVQSIASKPSGRVLLYGPPGCGKTALAYYLAELADKPIMIRRASDLIAAWHGETEKNICNMFNEATFENAVLLLDEADGFLRDRSSAVHSWQITQVNELLTQMECFNGLFICATNFMQNLDLAVMRRFEIKLKFDFLSLAQSQHLFNEVMYRLTGAKCNEVAMHKVRQALSKLTNLTPGDFSAIEKQFLWIGDNITTEKLIFELIQASQIKCGGRSMSIGFAG